MFIEIGVNNCREVACSHPGAWFCSVFEPLCLLMPTQLQVARICRKFPLNVAGRKKSPDTLYILPTAVII